MTETRGKLAAPATTPHASNFLNRDADFLVSLIQFSLPNRPLDEATYVAPRWRSIAIARFPEAPKPGSAGVRGRREEALGRGSAAQPGPFPLAHTTPDAREVRSVDKVLTSRSVGARPKPPLNLSPATFLSGWGDLNPRPLDPQ